MATKYEDLGSELTGVLISAGIAVHRELGPGLNEEDYERALSVELSARGIDHQCQVPLPLVYKGTHLDCGYRIDLMVMRKLLVEFKAVEKIHPVHEAQLITYLRLSGIQLGLLVNFAEAMLRDGIMRRAHSKTIVSQSRRERLKENSFDPLSFEVIDAALEVQHFLGSGLLQSAYESAIEHELKMRGIKVIRNLPAKLSYHGKVIPSAKEIPMIVDGRIMICCACVKSVEPVLIARQRSLLKASDVDIGLCLNFHSESMAMEVKRIRRSSDN